MNSLPSTHCKTVHFATAHVWLLTPICEPRKIEKKCKIIATDTI